MGIIVQDGGKVARACGVACVCVMVEVEGMEREFCVGLVASDGSLACGL